MRAPFNNRKEKKDNDELLALTGCKDPTVDQTLVHVCVHFTLGGSTK